MKVLTTKLKVTLKIRIVISLSSSLHLEVEFPDLLGKCIKGLRVSLDARATTRMHTSLRSESSLYARRTSIVSDERYIYRPPFRGKAAITDACTPSLSSPLCLSPEPHSCGSGRLS